MELGVAGLGAVLLNWTTAEFYPLYRTNPQTGRIQFQLPAITYLSLGIAHSLPLNHTQQPMLQWSEEQTVALGWVQKGLTILLNSLKQGGPEGWSAAGLAPERWHRICEQLTGVLLTCPTGWSDSYRFNLREAVLTAELVSQPEQILILEAGIAALLGGLAEPEATRVHWPGNLDLSAPPYVQTATPQRVVLSIAVGAATTELSLAYLGGRSSTLTREQIVNRSLALGKDGIDQDVICQLLSSSGKPQRRGSGFLTDILLPQAGEPDLPNRIRLRQRLENSHEGRSLLEAARHLQVALQHQEQWAFELAGQSWQIYRQTLEAQVLWPYLYHLNWELNQLFSTAGISATAIGQVILTGSLGNWSVVSDWLRQKFPQAAIVQDDARLLESGWSRVAWGLAHLPYYPQVADRIGQQYNDHFLLLELLRALPDHPLPLATILSLLERRGINTQLCQQRILACLENQQPWLSQTWLTALAASSRTNVYYQALTTGHLFQVDGQQYQINPQWRGHLRELLNELLHHTHQTLREPLMLLPIPDRC